MPAWLPRRSCASCATRSDAPSIVVSSGNVFPAGEMQQMRTQRAVGDICFRFYDAAGKVVRSPQVHRRVSFHSHCRRTALARGCRSQRNAGGGLGVLSTAAGSIESAARAHDGHCAASVVSVTISPGARIIGFAASYASGWFSA
jgi:hypothetical protein